MKIAVVNKSKMVSNEQLQIICAALQVQFNEHAAPAYTACSPSINFFASESAIPTDTFVLAVLDNADQAGVLGYHDENNDRPDGFVFCQPVLENGGTIMNGSNTTVSSVISHEALELWQDCYVGTYCDNGDTSWALELADPVQDGSYAINVNGNEVMVSNFVLPMFFNSQATAQDAPFDYMKQLSAPFSISSGGYAIVRRSGPGSEQQIFGEKMPAWLKKVKKNQFSRLSKRCQNKRSLLSKLFAFLTR